MKEIVLLVVLLFWLSYLIYNFIKSFGDPKVNDNTFSLCGWLLFTLLFAFIAVIFSWYMIMAFNGITESAFLVLT